jgi:hypothetical protein
MNIVHRWWGLALVFCIPAFASESWPSDPQRAAAELEHQWRQIEKDGSLPVRGTVHFALEATGLDWHPERVVAALQRARDMQDRDKTSRTYGNFKWQSEHERVFDLNAVEFAMQMLTLMHLQYAAHLRPEVRAALEDLMIPAIDGINSHHVKVDYTNIFLMQAWNRIAAGEALERPELAEAGYRQFDEWLRFTAQNGITEYASVNYYGTDLDSLVFISKFARRDDAKSKATVALHYIWTDIAANWWSPGDRLGGANSRSYDYLFGRGYLEAHTWPAGLLRVRPELEGANWLSGLRQNQIVFREAATFVPPPEWMARILSTVPRTIVQRWGQGPEHHAVNWIGHHVSLGSSGATRGADERTLVANFGDSPSIAQSVLFMDARGDPYGSNKTLNAASQAKALHLTPFIATVQHGPEVLQVLSDDPAHAKSKPRDFSCFLTHLTFPATAEVWIDNARCDFAEKTTPVPTGANVFIRIGDAVMGVRFLLATTAGESSPIEIAVDDPKGPARRITVVHARGIPSGRGTVAAYFRVAEKLDPRGFASFRDEFRETKALSSIHGDTIDAEVNSKFGPLHVVTDIVKAERRVLEGGERDALLSINGVDLGAEILSQFRP